MAVSPYHLTSNGPRINTLVIDLATLPTRKVNMDLIAGIVHQNLKIQFSNVMSLQHNTGKSLVFLECKSEDQVLAAVDINDGRHEIMVDNIKYAVGVYMEDGTTTVRVHDVSPQSENSAIRQALEKYGDVIWLKEEKYTEPDILKGIKSGVRAVRIKMHTAIPSYINICGEVTLITYKNQQQTCRHCNKSVHWGRKCMEVSYMEMQLQSGVTGNISDRLRASGVDYAGVLRAGNLSKQQSNISTGSGKGGTLTTKFTNLTQLSRSNQTTEKSPVITLRELPSKETTHTNTTDTAPEQDSLKQCNADQIVSDQMDTEQRRTEIAAMADEIAFRKPTIPLTNSYEFLISDDDMNGREKSRSRSSSPSRQRHRGRPKKSVK